MNSEIYEFDAEIQKVPDIDGAYVIFPYDIKKLYGKGRLKVIASFNGVPYSGSIVNMGVKNADGTICYIIGMTKAIRRQTGKQTGDKVRVMVKTVLNP
jgi:hypothetical protein